MRLSFLSKNKTIDPDKRPFFRRLFEDPYTGWASIVTASVVVAAALVAVSARTYLYVRSGDVGNASSAPSAAHQAFNPAALSNLLSIFDQRASTTAELAHGYSGPPDPSL